MTQISDDSSLAIRLILTFMLAFAGTAALAMDTATGGMRTLRGHVPAQAVARARQLDRVPSNSSLQLTITLPVRDQAELDDTLKRIYDPADPMYGKYLSTDEFTRRFSPAEEDYAKVVDHFKASGFQIKQLHANRLLVDVAGTARRWESSLRVQLHNYQDPDGRTFHAPSTEPQLPSDIAARVLHIEGLNNALVRHGNAVKMRHSDPARNAHAIGSGPFGGLTPDDINTAYHLTIPPAGSTQVLGLLELAGYNPNDIAYYQTYFGLTDFTVQNVPVLGGVTNSRRSADSEVTLDIEMMMALAPPGSTILVYQAPNSLGTAFLSILNQMATDNRAKQISISWGATESVSGTSDLQSENQIFQQMAAQGQSVFAAAGDSGAYDNPATPRQLAVDDPASQPYVVGVGGTQLSVSSNGDYFSETTWNSGSVSLGTGGGGVSNVWPLPSFQKGVAGAASATMRNVPDVALDADPDTGYAIFYGGSWNVFGGTSCGAPLWAAFAAQVNQQRVAHGESLMGFANPLLYQVARGSNGGTAFHDIADGSNNLHYGANKGYDDATGWGSFNGAILLADLATAGVQAGSAPNPPANLTATPGNASVSLNWTSSTSATGYNIFRGTAAGSEGRAAINATPVTGTSYQDASLTNGQPYFYKVTAINASGSSGYSNEASATPIAAQYSVLVAVSGSGTVASNPSGIACGVTCTANFASGASVELTATPNTGYQFQGWAGSCSGTSHCTITVDKKLNVQAIFRPLKVALTVVRSGRGSVRSMPKGIACGSRCDGAFNYGAQVSLQARPAPGYGLQTWGGDCAGTSTGACVLNLTAAANVSANFVPTCALHVTRQGRGIVTSDLPGIQCGPRCRSRYLEGTTVSLIPAASPGFAFDHWAGACSGTATCGVTMASAVRVIAVFVKQ